MANQTNPSFFFRKCAAILQYHVRRAAYKAQLRRTTRAALAGGGAISYWWNGDLNFGDLITPMLLKQYGFDSYPIGVGEAHFTGVGSVLDRMPDDYSGVIAGAGFKHAGPQRSFANANIIGLRGKLTLGRIPSAPENVTLGDPGLLAAKLMPARQDKKYVLGMVPHYVDFLDQRVRRVTKGNPCEVALIDVRQTPDKVFAAIDQCEHIIASSMHGLIIADALGIPSAWVQLSDRIAGGRFKFDDHFSSLDDSRDPIDFTGDESVAELTTMTKPPPVKVPEVVEKLDRMFSQFVESQTSKE